MTGIPNRWQRLASREVYRNDWIRVREDQVIRPDGQPGIYGVVEFKLGLGIVALNQNDEVWLLGQYRYPIDAVSWEIVNGTVEPGETPLGAAQRELAEEAGLAAERWSLLTTSYSTPGFCDELILTYLAEGLSEVDRPEGFTAENEELDMTVERVPLEEAVQRVFDGDIRNASAVAGVLAAAQVRSGTPRLRPADAG